MQRQSTGYRFNLGLRWLDAGDQGLPAVRGTGWEDFLAAAQALPEPRRLWLARLWPLLALVNGPLALSGLMLWPERSGVHLLLFLMVFVAAPLALMLWSAVAGLALGRPPWWSPLLIRHRDPVITLWCVRQSLLLHGLFCLAGLAWLWLMLATRQVIFYWSTSIAAVSEQVAGLFRLLSAGILPMPAADRVQAAEAGAITGWQQALLADSFGWASWLTQVVSLWVLLPWLGLLALCHWRWRLGVAEWPRHNQRLRLRFAQATAPAVGYRALQPEQPPVEPAGHDFPVLSGTPAQPGFGWRTRRPLPAGSVVLGEGDHTSDDRAIRNHGDSLQHWYVAANAVPTGDLADLLQLHRACGGRPALTLLLAATYAGRVDDLRHSWGVFLERNGLTDLPVQLLRDREQGHD